MQQRLIYQALRNTPNERMRLIRSLEEYILSRRRSVFLMPRPGSGVILLLSGGMDSVIAWHVLIRKYRLIPYPIAVVRGRFDPQERAVRHAAGYIRRSYPEHYRDLRIVRNPVGNDMTPVFRAEHMDPDELIRSYVPEHNLFEIPRLWGGNMWSAYTAYMYGQLLRYDFGVPVNTIFCGVTADDGAFVPSQTLTFLRMLMVSLMQLSQDDAWQFGSVYLEPALSLYRKKTDVARLGNTLGVPLSSTYSCDRRGFLHCGTCLSCQSRRYCFSKNRIDDRTLYANDLSVRTVLQKIRIALSSFDRNYQ